MWRILALKKGSFGVVNVTRRLHQTKPKSDWMLNNDIIRNAIAPKKLNRENLLENKRTSKTREIPKNSSNNFKPHNFHKNKLEKPQSRKNISVTWSTGSERDKLAANSVLSQIFRMNKAGVINIINVDDNKVQQTNIRIFAKGIDLSKVGFSIVNFEQLNETTQIPLVKLVDRKVALKKYSNEIADRKQKELLSMGILKKRPPKTSEADKAEDSIKRIKVSWQIKEDDLSKQKAHEIISQLKKGYKVHLCIDDRNNINAKNWSVGFENLGTSDKIANKALSSSELEKRTFILDKLQGIADDYSIQPVNEGTIETKMLIKLAPKTSNNKDREALKEQRKKERQQKLMKRLEKQKQREGEYQ